MTEAIESCTFITFSPVEDGMWFVKDFKTDELRSAGDVHELAANEPIGLIALARILNNSPRSIYFVMKLDHGEESTKINIDQVGGDGIVKVELRPPGRVAFFYEKV